MTKSSPMGNSFYMAATAKKAAKPEITIGEELCEKLRLIFYQERKSHEVFKDLAKKLTCLKEIAKKYYPEKTETERLQELRKWTNQDIKEAIEISQI